MHSGKSKSLEDVGLYSELVESGRYDAIRPRMFALDRQTRGRDIHKLVAAPDFMLGSVAAVTDDGTLIAASATGSQLGACAAGAGRLILIVGSQKIVPDLEAALRIRDIVFRERGALRRRLLMREERVEAGAPPEPPERVASEEALVDEPDDDSIGPRFDTLSDAERQEVADYVEFLATRRSRQVRRPGP